MNGTIEELNFQILQMQEQMRKMQEDNEFRFQELEQKKTDAGAKSGRVVAGAETPPAKTGGETAASDTAPADGGETATATGEPPKTFGTIVFDADGNVKGGATGDQAVAGTEAGASCSAPRPTTRPWPRFPPPGTPRNSTATPTSSSCRATTRPPRRASANTSTAIRPTPRPPMRITGSARRCSASRSTRDAAEIFAANRDFPSSKKAPDMMLKLGVSLAGLNQRDLACATLGEIGKRYPNASAQLKQRVKQEQALASC